MGYEALQPMPAEVRAALEAAWQRRGAVSPWVFHSLQNPARPYNRDVFDKWLRACETKAKVPALEGTLWHAFRRKWATERKGYSLIDVADAGGWKDVRTVQLYTQADTEMRKKVVSTPTLRLAAR